jgi:protein-tyrosine phosphatase
MGFVDLHCHLLWDLDDGCRSPAETLEAARALAEAGFTDVAATPHVQLRYGGGDPAAVRARLGEARALLARYEIPLALHPGGENIVDDGFDARELRALGDPGRYALVEVPFLEAVPALGEVVASIMARGVRPILAHPERCTEFEPDGRAEDLVAQGALLQLNLGALTGRHGPRARRLAERFLDGGLYAVIGSDLHAPDEAGRWIAGALRALERRAGVAGAALLCEENPRRVLAGEEIGR